jgi:glycine oxidase
MNIGIVGAGVIGRLLALRFSSDDHVVSLFDRNSQGRGGASWVAAGMLAPYCERERSAGLVHQLGVASLARWPDILGELDLPVFFQKTGSLVVSHSSDFAELDCFRRKIEAFGMESGFLDVGREDIRELEPEVGENFPRGIFFPHEGQLDPQGFFVATDAAFCKRRVHCFFGQVVEIHQTEINVGPESFRFDWVLDCRGWGAEPDWPTLRAVRGEVLVLETQEVSLQRPVRLLHPRYPLYIVPRPNGVFIVGATQLESSSTEPITVRSTLELLSAAYSVHPGFAEARVLRARMGLRPTLPDHLPCILQDGRQLRINGLYRHGYLVAPKIADLISDFIVHDFVPDAYVELFQREISHAIDREWPRKSS